MSRGERLLPGMLLAVVVLCISSVLAAQECSEKNPICDEGFFCSLYGRKECKSCADACAKNPHDCNEKCKDYIISNLSSKSESQATTIRVQYAIIGVLAVATVVLTVLLLKDKKLLGKCPQPWRAKNQTTLPVVMTHENPNTRSPTRPPKNGANLTRQNTQQTTTTSPEQDVENQTTITTISNRYPAEDSTEGLAYVNHACNVTPTSNTSAPRY